MIVAIKKSIYEMWEGTRDSRETKTGLVTLTFMSILAYAGVMALAYTIVGRPVFAVAYTNAFAATCVIFWRRRNSTAPMIKKQRIPTMECVMVPVITIVMTLGSTVLALWVKQSLNQPSPMQKLSETTPAIAIVIMSLIIAPIGEEALMRGFIYPVLRRKLSVTSTIVVTALLFAMLHGNIVQIVLTIPLGIALGYLYERTHNLLACISMHMLFNATALLLPSVQVRNLDAVAAALLVVITLGLWMCIPRIQAKRRVNQLIEER
jgi:membrane protease YdiL (CAAX protease family)